MQQHIILFLYNYIDDVSGDLPPPPNDLRIQLFDKAIYVVEYNFVFLMYFNNILNCSM